MVLQLSRNIRWIAAAVVFTALFVVLPSSVTVRSWIAAPLVVHDENARGDVCYVLAGGGSIWERLEAATDLYSLNRVNRIMLMRDEKRSRYNFKVNRSWTRTEWMLDYLVWHGIPLSKIVLIEQVDEMFGTLNEARLVAKQLPSDVKTVVVVSSAPHMRRTVLAFKRSLPADVTVTPYAATSYESSQEMTYSLWIEYFKLLVYYVIA